MHDQPQTPCPGPCNNAWRRSETQRETDGTEHHLTPAWGQPTQCDDCVERSRHHIEELPELLDAALLEALEGTPAKSVGTIGRMSVITWPGQASRLLVDRIVSEMAELQADILIHRGIWKPERLPERGTAPSEPDHIRRITRALLIHWDWAMQHHPAADEPHTAGNANPGGQASAWYRTLQVFTRRDNPRLQLAAPCPRCFLKTLSHSNGETFIACRNPECELLLSRAEYDQHAKEIADAVALGQAA